MVTALRLARRTGALRGLCDAAADPLFTLQSRRRVYGSPVLPLEAVAVGAGVQREVEAAINAHKLSPRELRKAARRLEIVRAPESVRRKKRPARRRGQPVVQPPPEYDGASAVSYAVMRSPGTLSANCYVMAEIRRARQRFMPKDILDFGAGVGVSVGAAARVFRALPFEAVGEHHGHRIGFERLRVKANVDDGVGHSLREAVLVDHAPTMHKIAPRILRADDYMPQDCKVQLVNELRDAPARPNGYDLVTASYSLNEVVRSAMASGKPQDPNSPEKVSISRDARARLGERRLRRTVRQLWRMTAPGGIFVVIEDGTAAGFETVLFARDTILRMQNSPPEVTRALAEDVEGEAVKNLEEVKDVREAEAAKETQEVRVAQEAEEAEKPREVDFSETTLACTAKVVAPCLHSGACPLEGTITRHRVCRFLQRLNRPLFLRNANPLPTGWEDEHFSYIVIEKAVTPSVDSPDNDLLAAEDSHTGTEEENSARGWGRLIRAPLRKGKHVALDACTADGALERRVVSKKNSPGGPYSQARKAKWGDVWPTEPPAKPQPLNF